MEEADGILYTEFMVISQKEMETPCPAAFTPRFVRTAHLYNIAFNHVSGNFAIAGLFRSIDVNMFEIIEYENVDAIPKI